MKSQTSIMIGFAVTAALVGFAVAGEPAAVTAGETTSPERATVQAIFDEIMETLPPDARAEVNAASVRAQTARADSQAAAQENVAGEPVRARVQGADIDEALKALPERVKQQVESTIEKIEDRNETRDLQFKELQQQNDPQEVKGK